MAPSAAHHSQGGASTRYALLAVFTVSGFSGLVYESVWTSYLKLLLGHAAHAQTLVLIIFMGGMAVGSWLAATRVGRWRNLLLGYAVVEVMIGIAGVAFHTVFDGAMALALESIFPALGSPETANLAKWSLAAALVAPQSVLLGMTFPLLSGALIRRFPSGSGHTIAALYFTNSLGAAIGVLASGFVLVPAFGLPGTVLIGGMLNVVLALGVWLASRRPAWTQPELKVDEAEARETATLSPAPTQLLLTIAFVTGGASFMYEIGWIRMLSLVLGASTHAFELMLSAFILGLALGSAWVRGRIDGLPDPLRFLGVVQVLMGLFALGTLVAYDATFDVMANIMEALARNDPGYTLYNLSSHAIAFAIMLPATFCAGTTLPLITHALLRRGAGEKSIGQVYAVNTLGAITGVIVAVHLVMPLLGLKMLITIGAAIDILAGAFLLSRARVQPAWHTWSVAGVVAIVATLTLVQLDVKRMVSGVFRYGVLGLVTDSTVSFHTDGKTATVSLVTFPEGVTALLTNGKSDASIQMTREGDVSSDELTMTLAGAISLAARPDAERVAVVGFGAGMSTHAILGSDRVKRVDTVEIEPRMLTAARFYESRIPRAFNDPRGVVHFDDARTFFASRTERYDLILSEPSNPWVSGIATLFTRQFYEQIERSLADNGVFAQWIHGYEISPPLMASVVTALGSVFDDYALYNLNDRDMLFVARNGRNVPLDVEALFAMKNLRADLTAVGVLVPRDITSRFLGSRAMLEPLFASYGMPANDDYFPVLDLGAVRARFMRDNTDQIFELRRQSLPLAELLEPAHVGLRDDSMTIIPLYEQSTAWWAAEQFVTSLGKPPEEWGNSMPNWLVDLRIDHALLVPTCGLGLFEVRWRAHVATLSERILPLLGRASADALIADLRPDRCGPTADPSQIAQLAVMEAVAERDPALMAAAAEAALRRAEFSRSARAAYLVRTALLGYIASGDEASAATMAEAWVPVIPTLEIDAEMRLLRQLALAGQAPTQAGTTGRE